MGVFLDEEQQGPNFLTGEDAERYAAGLRAELSAQSGTLQERVEAILSPHLDGIYSPTQKKRVSAEIVAELEAKQ